MLFLGGGGTAARANSNISQDRCLGVLFYDQLPSVYNLLSAPRKIQRYLKANAIDFRSHSPNAKGGGRALFTPRFRITAFNVMESSQLPHKDESLSR